MELLRGIWAVMERYPISKWIALIGFGLFFGGNGVIKQLGSYLLIGDTIFIAGILIFLWSLDEDEKVRAKKSYRHEFHQLLKENKYKTNSETSFDNTAYPSTNESIQQPVKPNEHIASKEVHKITTSDVLPDGHIRYGGCNHQNSPDKFLESSAGNLFRKCPQCETHIQFFSYLKSDGKKYNCPSCKLSGDKSSFYVSSAGSKYLHCPNCSTHFT